MRWLLETPSADISRSNRAAVGIMCGSGFSRSATSSISKNRAPGDADIDAAMAGNVCRCATYQRIRAAIKQAAKAMG